MSRPQTYNELVGMKKWVKFSQERINKGNFPTCTLYYGEEGTGKTSLMFLNAMALTCESAFKPCGQCPSCIENKNILLGKGQSTSNVIVLRMSVEGGRDAAKESLDHLSTAFTNGVKVVIYEECHRMDDKAQDVLLSPIEFLPKNVYVMFATTDILRLNMALLSRLTQIQIRKPSRKEMIDLLQRTALKEKMSIDSSATLEMIASWANDKPRAALGMLRTVNENGSVTYSDAAEYMNFLDTKAVLPIIKNLNGSILQGLNAIDELQLSKESQVQLAELLTEVLRVKRFGKSTRLTEEDLESLNDVLEDVEFSTLTDFLYDVSSPQELSKPSLIAAFLKHHPGRPRYEKHDSTVLRQELEVQSANIPEMEETVKPKVQTFESLIGGGKVIEKGNSF